jgi:hypothetical protein
MVDNRPGLDTLLDAQSDNKIHTHTNRNAMAEVFVGGATGQNPLTIGPPQ